MFCIYVLLQRIIILVVGSYENNCLNLAKYLDKPFGIPESLIALVREGKEVKERAQLLLIGKRQGNGNQEEKKKKDRHLLKEMAKPLGAISKRPRIFVQS